MLAAALDRGIIFLGFSEDLDLGFRLKETMALLNGTFAPAGKTGPGRSLLESLSEELNEYFNGTRKKFSLPLVPAGTAFQKKAWKALLNVPYGEVWSYSRQAAVMGNGSAVRAVGSADGKNRIPIIIPCHRIVKKDGSFGGYAGGVWRKEFLLQLEQKNKSRGNL